ncbi:NADPH-dependent oxidoreductase [Candidatus Saccharibacteria bacterium]|nr:NADPH-dependent oxidoreductase [Candidatus Saccharibacteria bacterium]
MLNIVVITGSARPNNVSLSVAGLVMNSLSVRNGVRARIVDLVEINLPFFNETSSPSSVGYKTNIPEALKWSRVISKADGIVFVSPEYNHGLSAVQKNAIDWLYHEWLHKPAAFVGYGWSGGKNSLAQLKTINELIKLKLGETTTSLWFNKDLNINGSVADKGSVDKQLDATLDELLENIELSTQSTRL